MQDYHINLFYSSEDRGYIADYSGSKILLGVRGDARSSLT